jgi:nucleoid DNA-binding protein
VKTYQKINPEREFDEFLSNLMFQTRISKQELKEIFISWFRYAITKLKKDKYMWLPFLGTFKLSSKKNRIVPNGRSHKSASVHKEVIYLKFKSSTLVKKHLYNRDMSVVDDMVKKIEEYYMGIINQ